MRKALILAYDFPPLNSIGAQRPYSWFKYFNEFGIEPIVVTRHWDREFNEPTDFYKESISRETITAETDTGLIIRVPFNPNLRDRLLEREGFLPATLRKLLSLAQTLTEHRLSVFDNKHAIYQEAENYLKANEVDIIIATGEPFILHSYASRLSKKFSTPWVADYRDGWSTNNNLDLPSSKNRLLKRVLERTEKSTASTASLVTTAAPDFSRRTAELLGEKQPDIQVLYNGYFEEFYEQLETVELNPVFSIAHAGTIYPFQKLETFLDGLHLFKKKNPDREMEITFYGLNLFPEQKKRIQGHPMNLEIQFTDKIPHEAIIEKLRSTHVQLLLATPNVNQIYAKVFDYLATGRPILLVENDKGPLEEMLIDRPNAALCSSAPEVCAYLEYAYGNSDLKMNHQNEDNTFTRRNQTKRFAEMVLNVIEQNETA